MQDKQGKHAPWHTGSSDVDYCVLPELIIAEQAPLCGGRWAAAAHSALRKQVQQQLIVTALFGKLENLIWFQLHPCPHLGVAGQSWAVPMQVAQLEEGRAYMATSPRDPKVFLHLCFSSLPWRLTLIPVGGTGSLHTCGSRLCASLGSPPRSLALTLITASPSRAYPRGHIKQMLRQKVSQAPWAVSQTQDRLSDLPSFQRLCVCIYHQADPSMLALGTFNWEMDFLLHFFSFSLFFPHSFRTVQLTTLCLLDLIFFAAFCSTYTTIGDLPLLLIPVCRGWRGW